jgi:hypothetical protein
MSNHPIMSFGHGEGGGFGRPYIHVYIIFLLAVLNEGFSRTCQSKDTMQGANYRHNAAHIEFATSFPYLKHALGRIYLHTK